MSPSPNRERLNLVDVHSRAVLLRWPVPWALSVRSGTAQRTRGCSSKWERDSSGCKLQLRHHMGKTNTDTERPEPDEKGDP